jgi:hypothetical protein
MKFGRSEVLSIRIKGIQNSATIKTREIRPTRPDNLADIQSPALKWAVCIFVHNIRSERFQIYETGETENESVALPN